MSYEASIGTISLLSTSWTVATVTRSPKDREWQVCIAWHTVIDLRLGSEQAGRLANAELVAVGVSTDVTDPAAFTQRLGCHRAGSSLDNALKLDL